MVRNAGVRIITRTLDLDAAPPALLAALRSLADRMISAGAWVWSAGRLTKPCPLLNS